VRQAFEVQYPEASEPSETGCIQGPAGGYFGFGKAFQYPDFFHLAIPYRLHSLELVVASFSH
jgi:hypothetical protein